MSYLPRTTEALMTAQSEIPIVGAGVKFPYSAKAIITQARRKIFEMDAKTIKFFRKNPVIACEILLGIRLTDVQKWMLAESWNKPHVLWACCRDFGKSFVGVILLILKAILYENQAIYIISSVGDQAKETFTKIEEIVLGVGKTVASIDSIKDIAKGEVKKSPTNKTGFSHNPSGFSVEFYNGSGIYTLNSNPDRARSRRATIVFFDEAAYCSDELITACEAFAAKESNFKTSTSSDFSPLTRKRIAPTQIIYSSSQDTVNKLFYKRYREYAKKMLAGNRDYFVCDLICDTAIEVYVNGRKYPPLLTRAKIEEEMKINREKAEREYYNKPTRDGGENQIVKWGAIRNNESFYLPVLSCRDDYNYLLSFDPARINDNSIVSVMELYMDELKGLCGRIVNCVNFIDTDSSKRFKLESMQQVQGVRNLLVDYNGTCADYEKVDMLLVDAGSGGGGVPAYADHLLEDFTGVDGKKHRGVIDLTYDLFAGYSERYPNAVDKIRMISPRKMRTQMVEETVELINSGVVQFPFEYKGNDFINIKTINESGEEIIKSRELTKEERLSLINIDLMKSELANIHRFKNSDNTTSTYALSLDKRNSMHDDRFYTLIMLCHRLKQLRRKAQIKPSENDALPDMGEYSCVSCVSF